MPLFGRKKEQTEEKEEKHELTDAERIEQGQILCRAIIEVLGKPKEHVEEVLRSHLNKIKETKGITVISENISEPEEVGKLFSTFANIELWFKNVSGIIAFCFDYMPSSIEILEPEQLTYNSREFAGFLNDLQARLHSVDMTAKNLTIENQLIKTNLSNITTNIVTVALKEKPKTIEELSKEIGIQSEQLERILTHILKEGIITKKGDKYSLVA